MRIGVVIFAITASVFIGSSAQASLAVLDQYQENWNISCDVGGPTKMAQTFTAGLTGTLDHIEIGTPDFGFKGETVPVVTLYQGQPDSGLSFLTSFTLSSSGYDEGFDNGLVVGNPTLPISINAGTMYSIVLEAASPWTAWVGAVADLPSSDPYTNGALWAYDENTWKLYTVGDPPVFDMQFRTYVQAIPLPAGIWLGICAVSVAGWHLKRQRA